MQKRLIEVVCDAETAAGMALVVATYARAAFPPGGSECAQVAREELLETARSCGRHAGGALQLRKRQLPMLRSAVEWYVSEGPGLAEEMAAALRGMVARR